MLPCLCPQQLGKPQDTPGHPHRSPHAWVPHRWGRVSLPGEMLVEMQEERSGLLLLPKRSPGEEEEAGRKEGLVCLFPERHRNCYMRHYLTSLTTPDALHPPLAPSSSTPVPWLPLL